MAGKTYSGTYVDGITLTNPKTENPATIGAFGYVTNDGETNDGTALFGTAAAAWTITNLGQINGKSGATSDGIRLLAGGFVTNGASGSTIGLITANANGVEIDGKPGTVVNFGAILGIGARGQGIDLTAGGSIVNGAAKSVGLIEGKANGVAIAGRAGTVVNRGTIVSAAGNGAILESGGAVTNDGTIQGQNSGVTLLGKPGSITNFGAILGIRGAGIDLLDGGRLTNEQGGQVTASRSDGVLIRGGAATVANLGTIVGGTGSSGAAVYLGSGGVVTNGESGKALGLIRGRRSGVVLNNVAGTVTNFGTIVSTSTVINSGSLFGVGVLLGAGGTLINGGAGKKKSHALISGKEIGVYIGGIDGTRKAGAAGRVVNYGTIQSTGLGAIASSAVLLVSGGRVTNRGLIESAGRSGVSFHNKAGTVTNFGSVVSNASGTSGVGVYLQDGGVVTNEMHGLIVAAHNAGVSVKDGAGSVVNFGRIEERSASSGAAVYLGAGGRVVNGESGKVIGLISGGRNGVVLKNLAGTVTNFGTIESTSTVLNNGSLKGAGVVLGAGGTLINGGAGSTGALITAREIGVYIGGTGGSPKPGAAGTVVNFGTIRSTGFGVIASSAVDLVSGGGVTNHGLIASAGRSGISFRNKRGTVTNFGSVVSTATGSSAVGVYLQDGGVVTNKAGGVIRAAVDAGVEVRSGRAAVLNLGTIAGGNASGLAAVYLGGGGAVSNGHRGSPAGVIKSGDGSAVAFANAAGRVVNFGTIMANGAGPVPGAAVEFSDGGAVANRGVIASAADTAILFANKAGSVTNFGVVASASNETTGAGIDLEDGGVITNQRSGMVLSKRNAGISVETAAGTIVNFGKIDSSSGNGIYFAAGGILTNRSGALIDGGVHGVYLASPNHTVTRVTNRGTIEGGAAGFVTVGAGTETLTNFGTIASTVGADGVALEFDNTAGGDVLIVEPHAVFVGAVLGGGNNEIEFVGAGAADMNGVDGFSTIVLANGVKHTLTLTTANFIDVSGATITAFDGNKGNTVSAADAPAGDAIIVHAGSGADMLTGGAGNDVFYAGGRTTMTGGAGTNEFIFSAPGRNTITDFAVSATNELVFSNQGFKLGLEHASATPTLLPARLLVSNGTGSFTNKHQRFAYDTTNGDLFYSASGSTAHEHLVVALTGAPPLTATPTSHLFYIT